MPEHVRCTLEQVEIRSLEIKFPIPHSLGVAKYLLREMYYNPCQTEGPLVMRQLLVTITLVLAVIFSALAQTTAAPDFSGTWVLSAAKSTLPKDSTIKSQTIVIDNKKSAIVFHYKTDGKKLTESYTPDGKKRVRLNLSSGQLTSSAGWHDSVLVIESWLDIRVPNATVVVTGLKPVIDTWTMAADGRTLIHDTSVWSMSLSRLGAARNHVCKAIKNYGRRRSSSTTSERSCTRSRTT